MNKKFLFLTILIFPFLIQTTSIAISQTWEDLYTQQIKYSEAKSYKKAIEFAKKAKIQAKKEFGTEHTNYVTSCYDLAKLYHKIKSYHKAETLYIETKEIFEKEWGKEHASYATICDNFARLYVDMSNYPKAELYILKQKI